MRRHQVRQHDKRHVRWWSGGIHVAHGSGSVLRRAGAALDNAAHQGVQSLRSFASQEGDVGEADGQRGANGDRWVVGDRL